MRLLLDTHALAWWVLDDRRLSSHVRRLLSDTSNQVWVSAVTAFEMALKHRVGKWDDIGEFLGAFENAVAEETFQLLNITTRHALLGGQMSGKHRDPFDRLLAAQSRIEGTRLVTNDPAFKEFETDTVW